MPNMSHNINRHNRKLLKDTVVNNVTNEELSSDDELSLEETSHSNNNNPVTVNVTLVSDDQIDQQQVSAHKVVLSS